MSAKRAHALEREAAIREILGVINESRNDETPVFETVLENTARMCNAAMAMMLVTDHGQKKIRLAASVGLGLRALQIGDEWNLSAGPLTSSIRDAVSIQTEDLAETDDYRTGDAGTVQLFDDEGLQTQLSVPLVCKGKSIGTIVLCRRDVAPFKQDDIELVRIFAAQTVIAIENVRQCQEVQSRLEREKATGKVLSVISHSRRDDVPVFDTILENAQALCGAPMSGLILAQKGDPLQILAAKRGVSTEALDLFGKGQMPMDGNVSYAARCIIEGRLVAFPDMRESDLYKADSPVVRTMVDDVGIRSVLFVPLMKDGDAMGCITLFRFEVRPFEQRHIELVQTFAAQAVIAIENVRQFRELQIRLEREQASRDVLQIISQSQEDEKPVFDSILENAARLCKSAYAGLALVNQEGTHLVYTASHGPALSHSKFGEMKWDLNGTSSFAEAITNKCAVRIDDLQDTELYRSGDPQRVAHVDEDGIRSFMAVPLMHGGEAIGAFGLARWEVAPFDESDMELVSGFAAQAVIAIENVRQFKALEKLNAELGDRVKEQVDEIERMGLLKRFLPAAVADTVVSQGSEKLLASHRALLGVLFCDIRGFTAFCETAEPEETIEVLQSYHEEMGALIAEHGAGVDTRAGDGIMVLFNDPLPCDDPAGDALRLGISMRARMHELCQRWRRNGHRLGFGVGISLGYATVGMVGSSGRYDYTASGTAVNLAARLCDQAENGEILLSRRAFTAVEEDFAAESIGEIALKGIHAPVEVFRVSGLE